jgi:hypothetical protein
MSLKKLEAVGNVKMWVSLYTSDDRGTAMSQATMRVIGSDKRTLAHFLTNGGIHFLG